ncbi:helix-turn-helix domain-containing protein [Paenibacillus sp. OV219]|uniref:helix-turn-helix domain-containing protein n=1 Tax=Paenibacillus sp. OV219 TaxID=1884377 RepID=UPI0008B1AE21|nr:AraC family transcriptional regulator [Paenibacillus sp. OV219]SEN87970.1 Helix-turn-helix domain-containing protein [Paenibacillus sp. OV219]
MAKTERLRRASNSLFLQLLLSFLAILVPLIAFFFFSFTFITNHATDEVIKYNTLSMNKTIDKYENHFNQIRNIGLDLLLDEKLETLNRPTIDYLNARALMRTINSYLSHKEIAVQNIFIYLKKSNFVISGDRGVRADELFSKYYMSNTYTPASWEKQFSGSGGLSILPTSDFSEKTVSGISVKGRYMPVVIRNAFFPDYQVIVMLDVNLMLKEFQDSPEDPFLMFDKSGLQLSADNVSDKMQSLPFTPSAIATSHVKKDGIYYFSKKGSVTGIQYMKIVPDNQISAQISRFNTILLSLLLLFAAVSVCAAWFFTKRFHNPVKSIMQSIQQLNATSHAESSIHEFKYIHDQVRHLVETSNTIDHADARKNSLLRYYSFLNKLKNINVKDQEFYDFNIQGPYRLLLFRLQFTPRFFQEIDADEGKASLFVREYLDTHLKEHAETQTVQLEHDLILSLVIGGELQEELPSFLTSLKAIFDLDQRYWSMTIGVGSLYRSSSDLTRAYEQVQSIMEYRKLGNSTQILTASDAPPDYQAVMSGLQEQELQANLAAGNEEGVLRLITKVLGVLDKKGATANQCYDFAESIIQLAAKTVSSLQLDMQGYKGFFTSLGKLRCCCTVEELQSYLASLLTYVIARIHEKKAEKDNIIAFVMSYTEQHYQHDITLDILSDKLGISASYLSTYFKMKTGTNFIDYINNYRIELAKSLLRAADLRIQDVALQVGYQNINSFNRMFKKISGVTPSEFRKQQFIMES